ALKLGAPPDLDTNIGATVQPAVKDMPPVPSTVDSPDRPPRYLSLPEALAIALEQGTTGFLTLGNGVGQANESIDVSFSRPGGSFARSGIFTDSIRAFALDPAIAGANIEGSLAKFDAHWLASQTWGKRDDA